MKKRKEPNYLFNYTISLLITLAIHYLVFAKMNVHPTIHLIIGFFIFSIIIGLITLISEKLSKK